MRSKFERFSKLMCQNFKGQQRVKYFSFIVYIDERLPSQYFHNKL